MKGLPSKRKRQHRDQNGNKHRRWRGKKLKRKSYIKMNEVKQKFRSKHQDWQLSGTESPIQSTKQLIMGRNKLLQNTPSASLESHWMQLGACSCMKTSSLHCFFFKILCCKAIISSDWWSTVIPKSTKTWQMVASIHKMSHSSNYCPELVLKLHTQHLVTKIRRSICFCLNRRRKSARCLYAIALCYKFLLRL